MDALCKFMFIIIETMVNIEHEKNLFISIRLMKKEIQGSHYFSFFCTD